MVQIMPFSAILEERLIVRARRQYRIVEKGRTGSRLVDHSQSDGVVGP